MGGGQLEEAPQQQPSHRPLKTFIFSNFIDDLPTRSYKIHGLSLSLSLSLFMEQMRL